MMRKMLNEVLFVYVSNRGHCALGSWCIFWWLYSFCMVRFGLTLGVSALQILFYITLSWYGAPNPVSLVSTNPVSVMRTNTVSVTSEKQQQCLSCQQNRCLSCRQTFVMSTNTVSVM